MDENGEKKKRRKFILRIKLFESRINNICLVYLYNVYNVYMCVINILKCIRKKQYEKIIKQILERKKQLIFGSKRFTCGCLTSQFQFRRNDDDDGGGSLTT